MIMAWTFPLITNGKKYITILATLYFHDYQQTKYSPNAFLSIWLQKKGEIAIAECHQEYHMSNICIKNEYNTNYVFFSRRLVYQYELFIRKIN